MKKVFALSCFALALTGCASVMNVGSPEYACSGMPEGVSCVSARDVYSATESDNYQTQLAREQAEGGGNGSSSKGESTTQETRVLYPEGFDNAPIPMRARNPMPIRSQAVVMRIAVDPWEDENGDLYVPGFIYTEIEPRRWEIGARQPEAAPTLRPLSSVQK